MTSPGGTDAGDRAGVIARTVHGLEWVCAWEISTRTGLLSGIRLRRREVRFEVGSIGPRLLDLRTADDVFRVVGVISDVGQDKASLPPLGRDAAGLDWPAALRDLRAVRALPGQLSFDVVASIEGRRAYNRFAVENRVGLALAPVLGAAFLERDSGGRRGGDPGLTVRVFVRDGQAVVALRLAPRPLHRRAYKVRTGPGTLHPPTAAALALLGAPRSGVLLDPFCGDGTIAIEAALAHPGLTVMASDIDPLRVLNARKNAWQAGADVDIRSGDAVDAIRRQGDLGAVVTNPPWNQAVQVSGRLRDDGAAFWNALAPALGQGGLLCCLTDADLETPLVAVRQGWQIGLEQRIRLAGRVADLLLAAPPGQEAPQLPAGLTDWREKAMASGVVSRTGF